MLGKAREALSMRCIQSRQKPAAADPTFIRLTHELMLCYRVKRKIERGQAPRKHSESVKELERRSWTALADYASALAFVDDIDGKLVEEEE
jgi:hypothetical protein